MGWTSYCVYGKIDRLTECRKHFGQYPEWATILKDALVGDVYYAAMKSAKENEVWALIVLTDVANGEFAYKDMDETTLPFFYDCPNSILKLLTKTENERANEWRRRCYANTSKRPPEKPKKDPLAELKKYLGYNFSSNAETGSDYKSFQTKYINYLRRLCKENGWTVARAYRGHYSFSCFIKNAEDKYICLSIDDVRNLSCAWYYRILITTAQSDVDFRGGIRNYTSLEDLQESVEYLFRFA